MLKIVLEAGPPSAGQATLDNVALIWFKSVC